MFAGDIICMLRMELTCASHAYSWCQLLHTDHLCIPMILPGGDVVESVCLVSMCGEAGGEPGVLKGWSGNHLQCRVASR